MAAGPRPDASTTIAPSLGCDLPRHTGLRLGFLTRLEVGADAADSYRFALEMFTAAEELGYDVGWIAQHHFLHGDGRLPSVFPFLAAAAQRTRRIGLGTGVVTLPLDDPLRVAEDAAFVDTISGGRLELGLGDPLGGRLLDLLSRLDRQPGGFAFVAQFIVVSAFGGHCQSSLRKASQAKRPAPLDPQKRGPSVRAVGYRLSAFSNCQQGFILRPIAQC